MSSDDSATSGAARSPVLVGCAHGTRDPRGRRAVARVLLAVARARPELEVRATFVDVQRPAVAEVVAQEVGRGRQVVVVPLLLSAGYHVYVDIAEAVAGVTGAVTSGALGPDDRLTDLVVERLRHSGAKLTDALVLAAAGSSDARATADVERVLSGLRDRWQGPVSVGYGASASPRVPEAVAAARAAGAGRVAIAGYLLAPGFFHDRLTKADADLVSAPLADPDSADSRLVQVVLDRYEAAAHLLPA